MRTKIIHGCEDNDHFYERLSENDSMPDDNPNKISEEEFYARWLSLLIICDKPENYEPCMNCFYYGEFKTIEAEWFDYRDRWQPAIYECIKLCMNCEVAEDHESHASTDESIDSIS